MAKVECQKHERPAQRGKLKLEMQRSVKYHTIGSTCVNLLLSMAEVAVPGDVRVAVLGRISCLRLVPG
jgi:hypothetical protein